MATELVFVGTYSEPLLFGTGQVMNGKGKGIYAFRFDPATGALDPSTVTEGVRNSSYLAFDPTRRFLYCVNEFKEYEGKASGAVSAYRIDPATGALAYLNTVASHGTDPCHLIVDASGRNVLVANFASGGVCVLPVRADGSLGEASLVIQHAGSSIDPVRQKGPHAHAVAIDRANRFVFVPDLGMDKVMIYAFDPATGSLTANAAQPFVATKPGAGPRQLVMHPGGGFAYLINELDSTMTAFRYDAARGTLAELQTLSTLPAGFDGRNSCAEVQIAPSGRFLYGSNRGHNSIAIFAIDPNDGTLALRGHESTRGRIPRNFEVSPDGAFLIAANQDTSDLYSFRIDPATGLLSWTGNKAEAGTPICVRFL
ncbi:MAG: lactonase family protein [Alphaproteobacteria bacterium]|nr:lactonase family protein [Alphaproteobacteria bacterium]